MEIELTYYYEKIDEYDNVVASGTCSHIIGGGCDNYSIKASTRKLRRCLQEMNPGKYRLKPTNIRIVQPAPDNPTHSALVRAIIRCLTIATLAALLSITALIVAVWSR